MEKLELTVKIFLPFNNVYVQDPIKLASIYGYEQWFIASDGVGLCAAIIHGDDSSAHMEYFPLSFLNYRILDKNANDNNDPKKGYVSEDALIEIIKTLTKKDEKETK